MRRSSSAASSSAIHPLLFDVNQALTEALDQHATSYANLEKHANREIARLVEENFSLTGERDNLRNANIRLTDTVAEKTAEAETARHKSENLEVCLKNEKTTTDELRDAEDDLAAQLAVEQDDGIEFRRKNVVLLAESRREVQRLRKDNAELEEKVADVELNCEWFRDELTDCAEQAAQLKQEQEAEAVRCRIRAEQLAEQHASQIAGLLREHKQGIDEALAEKEAMEKGVVEDRAAAEAAHVQLEMSKQLMNDLSVKVSALTDSQRKLQEDHNKLGAAHIKLQSAHCDGELALEKLERSAAQLRDALAEEQKGSSKAKRDLDYEQNAVREFQNANRLLKVQVTAAKSLLGQVGPRFRREHSIFRVLVQWLCRLGSGRYLKLTRLKAELADTELQLEQTKGRCAKYQEISAPFLRGMSELERNTPGGSSHSGHGVQAAVDTLTPAAGPAQHQNTPSGADSSPGHGPPPTPVSPATQTPWALDRETPARDTRRPSGKASNGPDDGLGRCDPTCRKRSRSPEPWTKPPARGPRSWRRSGDSYRPSGKR
ncbi:hypothetical protein LTR85_008594 [Meristemomyces frigidus]|nr:hypothetical protein LTR85_008594 [Meristemomyces frigidus]